MITVKSLTGQDITLNNLSVPNGVIPGDGTVLELTAWNGESEIREDPELRSLVDEEKVALADSAENPRSPSGTPLMEPQPREGSSAIVVSYNWCDPCTWYGDSVQVTDEQLSDSGNGLTWDSAHSNWIDLVHGRLYGEDRISSLYRPVVKVNGVQMTERPAFANEGGDYLVDYTAGTVTFFASQAGHTVTADYSYENGSTLYVRPEAGKVLIVEDSEVQFSLDIIMNDTIMFQPWAYNPYDLPNKVPVAQATVYKKIHDFIDESRGVYPVIPAIGGPVRGTQHDTLNFPFLYKTIKELRSSQGVEVRVWLKDHKHMDGEFATATFYCTSKDER